MSFTGCEPLNPTTQEWDNLPAQLQKSVISYLYPENAIYLLQLSTSSRQLIQGSQNWIGGVLDVSGPWKKAGPDTLRKWSPVLSPIKMLVVGSDLLPPLPNVGPSFWSFIRNKMRIISNKHPLGCCQITPTVCGQDNLYLMNWISAIANLDLQYVNSIYLPLPHIAEGANTSYVDAVSQNVNKLFNSRSHLNECHLLIKSKSPHTQHVFTNLLQTVLDSVCVHSAAKPITNENSTFDTHDHNDENSTFDTHDHNDDSDVNNIETGLELLPPMKIVVYSEQGQKVDETCISGIAEEIAAINGLQQKRDFKLRLNLISRHPTLSFFSFQSTGPWGRLREEIEKFPTMKIGCDILFLQINDFLKEQHKLELMVKSLESLVGKLVCKNLALNLLLPQLGAGLCNVHLRRFSRLNFEKLEFLAVENFNPDNPSQFSLFKHCKWPDRLAKLLLRWNFMSVPIGHPLTSQYSVSIFKYICKTECPVTTLQLPALLQNYPALRPLGDAVELETFIRLLQCEQIDVASSAVDSTSCQNEQLLIRLGDWNVLQKIARNIKSEPYLTEEELLQLGFRLQFSQTQIQLLLLRRLPKPTLRRVHVVSYDMGAIAMQYLNALISLKNTSSQITAYGVTFRNQYSEENCCDVPASPSHSGFSQLTTASETDTACELSATSKLTCRHFTPPISHLLLTIGTLELGRSGKDKSVWKPLIPFCDKICKFIKKYADTFQEAICDFRFVMIKSKSYINTEPHEIFRVMGKQFEPVRSMPQFQLSKPIPGKLLVSESPSVTDSAITSADESDKCVDIPNEHTLTHVRTRKVTNNNVTSEAELSSFTDTPKSHCGTSSALTFDDQKPSHSKVCSLQLPATNETAEVPNSTIHARTHTCVPVLALNKTTEPCPPEQKSKSKSKSSKEKEKEKEKYKNKEKETEKEKEKEKETEKEKKTGKETSSPRNKTTEIHKLKHRHGVINRHHETFKLPNQEKHLDVEWKLLSKDRAILMFQIKI